MFKRLMRFLCGPEPKSTRQQLRDWLQSFHHIPERVAMPPHVYNAIRRETESRYCFWIPVYPQNDKAVTFDGVEIFPDPTVTEFTSR